MEVINPLVRRFVRSAVDDPEEFWTRAASELPWFRKWDNVFEWTPPTFRWFVGGQTNLCYNCLDYHVERGRGGRAALIAEDERGGRRVYTYAQLLCEVKRVAAALRGMGIKRGDRIAIYMPTCPEAIMVMLAAVRIGAIHVAIFAGFGAAAFADRVVRTGARAIFASDITYRKGKDVSLKDIVDDCLAEGADQCVERVVLLRRTDADIPMKPGRDINWRRLPGARQGPGRLLRGHGSERAGVHPADVRHDRQAQAGGAHARRLSGAHLEHGQLALRPERERRLVVDVRHRLDRWSRLHCPCAAALRLRDHRLRGRARLPGPGDLLSHH